MKIIMVHLNVIHNQTDAIHRFVPTKLVRIELIPKGSRTSFSLFYTLSIGLKKVKSKNFWIDIILRTYICIIYMYHIYVTIISEIFRYDGNIYNITIVCVTSIG